ncbi:MAG: galactose-binding domain-containing protein [Planctomycetota bacterium]|jgi:hypothetical protein
MENKAMKAKQVFLMTILWAMAVSPAYAIEYPSTAQPGQANVRTEDDKIILQNDVLRLVIERKEGKLKPASFSNLQTGETLGDPLAEFFHVTVGTEKKKYACSQFVQGGKCRIVKIKAEPESRTAAKRYSGVQVQAGLTAPDKTFSVKWSVELRDGSNYVRQFLTIQPANRPIQIASVQFNDLAVSSAHVAGTVAGSPVIANDFFIAYEHPNAANEVFDPSVSQNLAYRKSVTASGVFGNMIPEIAVDGNLNVNSYWGCQHTPVWLTVDLGRPVPIDKVRLVTWYDNKRSYGYKIESSTDKKAWKTIVDAADNKASATSAGYVHQVNGIESRYLKVIISKNSAGNHYGGHIVELQVYGPEEEREKSESNRIVCRLDRKTVLQQGQSLVQSAVMGVVPKGQLRRGFLHYIERQRIVPYRPFLHYNSWYDIAWGGREKMNSDECVEVIRGFGTQMTSERGVRLDSFVFDDGWDDPKTLWKILKENFPNGFAPLQKEVEKYGSKVGLWLSPWGGYGKAKADRLEYGKTQGFETSAAGFSLVGEKYFARFRESCVGFVKQYNVNFFKFDGVAANLLDETEALLRLCRELYSVSDDMYISLTTGTWASPFWLLHADNVWRGGGDMGFHGKGAKREQWLTYRDKITYQNMVKGGPLYPLNSFMNQGIAHAIWGVANLPAEREEFAHEVHSFFGIGTNLQELYISHGRMTDEMWDILAEGAKWSRRNSDVLIDTHWIGGDPGKLEVYGCASWQNNKAIIMLRNPDEKEQTVTLDIGQALELPPFANMKYTFKSPWQKDKTKKKALILRAGAPHTFELAPFEVLVLESTQSK